MFVVENRRGLFKNSHFFTSNTKKVKKKRIIYPEFLNSLNNLIQHGNFYEPKFNLFMNYKLIKHISRSFKVIVYNLKKNEYKNMLKYVVIRYLFCR